MDHKAMTCPDCDHVWAAHRVGLVHKGKSREAEFLCFVGLNDAPGCLAKICGCKTAPPVEFQIAGLSIGIGQLKGI